MATRSNKPFSVTLGPLAARTEARVRDGDYASVSEVVRAGLRALEREEEVFDTILKAKVAEALADTRPPVPAAEAFTALDERIAAYKAGLGR